MALFVPLLSCACQRSWAGQPLRRLPLCSLIQTFERERKGTVLFCVSPAILYSASKVWGISFVCSTCEGRAHSRESVQVQRDVLRAEHGEFFHSPEFDVFLVHNGSTSITMHSPPKRVPLMAGFTPLMIALQNNGTLPFSLLWFWVGRCSKCSGTFLGVWWQKLFPVWKGGGVLKGRLTSDWGVPGCCPGDQRPQVTSDLRTHGALHREPFKCCGYGCVLT